MIDLREYDGVDCRVMLSVALQVQFEQFHALISLRFTCCASSIAGVNVISVMGSFG